MLYIIPFLLLILPPLPAAIPAIMMVTRVEGVGIAGSGRTATAEIRQRLEQIGASKSCVTALMYCWMSGMDNGWTMDGQWMDNECTMNEQDEQ